MPMWDGPARAASQRRHCETNKYVLDDVSGLWWTRDFAQHGQCIFKTYKLVGDVLEWENDRDGKGDPIPKHKSKKLKEIQYSETDSCPYPERHLS